MTRLPYGDNDPLLKKVGAWRSLVAYLNGVQRAGGSNPLAPTNNIEGLADIGNPYSFSV